MTWIMIAVIGAAVGFLGGAFGKGGSAIATPLLAAIGVPPIVAVAAPLPATVPGTLVAFRRYQREGWADRRVILGSLGFGIPATIAGALATRWIDGSHLVVATDVIVAAIGLRVLLTRHPSTPAVAVGAAAVADVEAPAPSRVRLALVAATVGFLAGLLANSGGFLLVPLYLTVLRLPIKRALACSLAVASVLAVPGTIVHAALGHIDWAVAAVFGAASIPLSSLGARTALRMDAARLERWYGGGLLVLGITMLLVGHR